MGLYLVGRIYQVEFRWNGIRVRRTTGETSKTRAEAKAKQIKKAYKSAHPRRTHGRSPWLGRPVPLQVLQKTLLAKRRSRKDYPVYEKNIRYIVAMLGPNTHIDKIDDDRLARLYLGEKVKSLLLSRRDLSSDETVEELTTRLGCHPRGDGSQLEMDELDDLLDELEEDVRQGERACRGLSNATVRDFIIDPVMELLTLAESKAFEQSLPLRPARKDHRFKSDPRCLVLSRRQQIRLKEICEEEGNGLYPFFEAAIESLLRKNNLRLLSWDQIDWDAKKITVIQKGGRAFVREINDTLYVILDDMWKAHLKRKAQGIDLPYVFTQKTKSGDYAPIGADVSQKFRVLAEKAGCSGARLHDLRRTGATRMFDATSLRDVRDALGHADDSTTSLYIGRREGASKDAERKRVVNDRKLMKLAQAEHDRERGAMIAQRTSKVGGAQIKIQRSRESVEPLVPAGKKKGLAPAPLRSGASPTPSARRRVA